MSDNRYGQWLARVAADAGYDTAPGRGGRARLAKATGIDQSVLGKALDGQTIPSVEVQRRLTEALNRGDVDHGGADISLSEMLLRSGTLKPGDLPSLGEAPPPNLEEIDLYAVARLYDIPSGDVHLFVRSVEALAKTFADEQKGSKIGAPQAGRLSVEG